MVVVNNKNVTAAATLTKKGRKVTVEERERPTCPICCCVFYATERPEDVNKHLAACSRKATEATPQEEKYQEEAKTAEAAVIVSRPLSVMSPLFSRALVVGVCGNDLGSLAASVEELASRRVQPRPILCDRVMQGLLKSRCVFVFRIHCCREMVQIPRHELPFPLILIAKGIAIKPIKTEKKNINDNINETKKW